MGVVIILLALRVAAKWVRGDYRLRAPLARRRAIRTTATPGACATCAAARASTPTASVRTPRQAFAIGTLHGLAGTGAVVVLLIAALPTQLEAVAALAVFAPMSILSMAVCTSAFAWVLTRPLIEPVYRTAVIPVLGAFGLMFGLWYAGRVT